MLQKDATRTLPRFSLRLKVVTEHLHNKAWLVGLSLDLGGALFMVAAYALAPVRACSLHNAVCIWTQDCTTSPVRLQVSVVQPVGGSGLGITAVFSHFYLKVGHSTTQPATLVPPPAPHNTRPLSFTRATDCVFQDIKAQQASQSCKTMYPSFRGLNLFKYALAAVTAGAAADAGVGLRGDCVSLGIGMPNTILIMGPTTI